ncbi:MAG: polymer-forming cytoskeletal protein [Lachnospiraceae bacterium]|nr:polymer-forming cytoskeletal protein [Lachnospiraceae bacterium]
MGFFSNLREDIAQAVNELTEENADKEIDEAKEQIRMDLEAMEEKDYFQMHAESVSGYQAEETNINGINVAIAPETAESTDNTKEESEIPEEERKIEIIPRDVENIEEIMDEPLDNVGEPAQAKMQDADDVQNADMQDAAYAEESSTSDNTNEEFVVETTNDTENAKEEIDDSLDELLEFIDNNSIDDLLVLDGADENEMEEVKNEYGEINTVDEERINARIEETIAEEQRREEEKKQAIMESMALERKKSKAKPYTEIKSSKEKTKVKETMDISPEHTVITTGTTITGDINSNGDVEVYGGKVVGKIESECRVIVGDKSVVMGDIISKGAIISGAVKGDIDVHGTVVLESTAVVYGNIKSECLEINSGAVTEGLCSQCYAKNNPKDFFDKISE